MVIFFGSFRTQPGLALLATTVWTPAKALAEEKIALVVGLVLVVLHFLTGRTRSAV